ncbi:TonB-like protein [Rhodopseudomonas palustris HaA2]|uniref:TonB-like protein n=1 Tax=Rhodopseudomonas palustris (strain HaA2) TaxID=316058 RepID=Q2J0Q7_RHOP2|nr:energy transducer TonB [Rhodopseudomonas palustris]ABD05953.1 TonB-like protein [Rhodopseudomonas palustris HaA2]
MNAFALHEPPGKGRASQWLLSAAAIVAAHLGLIAAAVAWYQQALPPGVEMPAILVDMAPAPSAPAVQPQDLAPGPQMQQSQAAPEPVRQDEPEPDPVKSEPVTRVAAQQAEPIPVAPTPEVALPVPARQPAKPDAAEVERPKVAPVTRDQPKRKPERAEPKRASREPPAPRTTAAPRAERQAALQSSPNAGRAAAAAALPSYRERLAAHLARFKQYPSSSKAAGETGTAMLSFTVGRHGQVLGSRLARSAGHAALDAETMAMIRRAQPLPAFPPEMTQSSASFTVPVIFSLR